MNEEYGYGNGPFKVTAKAYLSAHSAQKIQI